MKPEEREDAEREIIKEIRKLKCHNPLFYRHIIALLKLAAEDCNGTTATR